MKLYEAASVFLIIGGVLLGPIERKMVVQPEVNIQQYQHCMDINNAHSTTQSWAAADRKCKEHLIRAGVVYETIAETCDRALAEIGVSDGSAHRRTGYSIKEVAIYRLLKPPFWPVVCIPAPTGLVR